VPEDPLIEFAATLRAIRRAKGLTQERLAEETGLHFSDVSRIERGVREPGVRVARNEGEHHRSKTAYDAWRAKRIANLDKRHHHVWPTGNQITSAYKGWANAIAARTADPQQDPETTDTVRPSTAPGRNSQTATSSTR
jgi:cytoskeletal protein RodZ